MFYWVLFIWINVGGINFETNEGLFQTKEECVETAKQLMLENKDIISYKCKGAIK